MKQIVNKKRTYPVSKCLWGGAYKMLSSSSKWVGSSNYNEIERALLSWWNDRPTFWHVRFKGANSTFCFLFLIHMANTPSLKSYTKNLEEFPSAKCSWSGMFQTIFFTHVFLIWQFFPQAYSSLRFGIFSSLTLLPRGMEANIRAGYWTITSPAQAAIQVGPRHTPPRHSQSRHLRSSFSENQK